jgi:hypothetical protein
MALTQVEKDILRHVVEGKKADEMKAISLSDTLAREKIAEFVNQQSTPMHDILLERQEESAQAQLAAIQAKKDERVLIKVLINQLVGE